MIYYSEPDVASAVAAEVNGQEIRLAQVDARWEKLANQRNGAKDVKGSTPLTAKMVRDFRKAALEDAIDDLLIKQFLTKEKVTVSQMEIHEQLTQLKASLIKRGSTYETYLKETGQTDSLSREQFELLIGFEKFAERTGTNDELKKYYTLHRDYFDNVRVKTAAILIRVPAEAKPGEWATARQQAEQIAKRITEDPKQFETFARDYPYIPNRTDLGWLTRFDSPVDDKITTMAFTLKINEVSSILELSMGLVLVKSLQRSEPKPQPFEDIQDWVRDSYTASLRKVVLAKQRQSASIRITLP
jgi:hypothetical protein